MRIEVDKKKLDNVCAEYGLDSSKALYYTNVVVIPGKDNLYVTLDRDCNVIDVREYVDRFGGQYNYFEGIYTVFNDDIISDLNFNYEGGLDSAISLGTIIKITNRYSKYYGGEPDENFTEDQKNLVSYFTFLRQVMSRYLLYYYQMRSAGYSFPNSEEYIKSVVRGINDYVKRYLSNNIKPGINDLMILSVNNSITYGEQTHLKDAIKLLIKCNGYKPHKEYSSMVVPMSDEEEIPSISTLICGLKDAIVEEKTSDKSIQMKKVRRREERR